MLKVSVLAGAALILGACATGAQREMSRMQQGAAATFASSRSCLSAAFAKPEYVALSKKMFLSAETVQYPLQYLTETSKPTKAEVATMYALHGDVQACRKIVLDGMATVHPLYVATLIQTYTDADRLWADAAAGKMTWGEFNKAREAAATEAQAKMMQADGQVTAQLQNQHQFEVEQRQRAAAAFQQWAYQQQVLAQQQQAINAMNQPRMINCNYFGNTASCTSH